MNHLADCVHPDREFIIMKRTLKIGLSARLAHPRPDGKGLESKTLQYLEQSVAQWIMARDVLVFMVPSVTQDGLLNRSAIRLSDYAKNLDGLVLQGGADIDPAAYGEAALQPEWAGDRTRDMYEMELLHEFLEDGKPVLGICRGAQLINASFGGTLIQDIHTLRPQARAHVDPVLYDELSHRIRFEPGSRLELAYAEHEGDLLVNSIHHQAVDRLGSDLVVEARSEEDGIVEAIRATGSLYVAGVQWHPEFHWRRNDRLDPEPLMKAFLQAVRSRAESA